MASSQPPQTQTWPCRFIIKTADLGWRQHKQLYALHVSAPRKAFVVRPLEGASAGAAPSEAWARSGGGRAWATAVGSRKIKITHDKAAAAVDGGGLRLSQGNNSQGLSQGAGSGGGTVRRMFVLSFDEQEAQCAVLAALAAINIEVSEGGGTASGGGGGGCGSDASFASSVAVTDSGVASGGANSARKELRASGLEAVDPLPKPAPTHAPALAPTPSPMPAPAPAPTLPAPCEPAIGALAAAPAQEAAEIDVSMAQAHELAPEEELPQPQTIVRVPSRLKVRLPVDGDGGSASLSQVVRTTLLQLLQDAADGSTTDEGAGAGAVAGFGLGHGAEASGLSLRAAAASAAARRTTTKTNSGGFGGRSLFVTPPPKPAASSAREAQVQADAFLIEVEVAAAANLGLGDGPAEEGRLYEAGGEGEAECSGAASLARRLLMTLEGVSPDSGDAVGLDAVLSAVFGPPALLTRLSVRMATLLSSSSAAAVAARRRSGGKGKEAADKDGDDEGDDEGDDDEGDGDDDNAEGGSGKGL